MKHNQIYMIEGTDYEAMTKTLVSRVDLAGMIRKKREALGKGIIRIAIKPNLVSASPASYGATTHPEVVSGLISYLQENAFKDIVIMEGSWVGDKTSEVAEVCGYYDLAEKYHVPFIDMQKEKGVAKEASGIKLNVCKAVEDVDYLINVPVLKGHCQTKITCALKNMKGLIPNAEKRRFHSMGLHKPIAHVNTVIHQDFILVDNICGDLDF
ncbi:MAG: DUF362 domain-containing protein, partial [Lachnospiraceae bacterium]|nr:DUF362 domain-containing protein [Candidatus Equihabitans merdae]